MMILCLLILSTCDNLLQRRKSDNIHAFSSHYDYHNIKTNESFIKSTCKSTKIHAILGTYFICKNDSSAHVLHISFDSYLKLEWVKPDETSTISSAHFKSSFKFKPSQGFVHIDIGKSIFWQESIEKGPDKWMGKEQKVFFVLRACFDTSNPAVPM